MSRSQRNKKRPSAKNRKWLPIVAAVAFFFGVVGIFVMEELAGKVFYLLVAAGSGYFLWKRFIKFKSQKNAQPANNTPLRQQGYQAVGYNMNSPVNAAPVQAVPVPLEPPQRFMGLDLAYQYFNVEIAMASKYIHDFTDINLGEHLCFVQEPQNPYDNRAVQVWKKDQMLGYVYHGKIQDMINDFITRNEPVYGIISSIYPAETKVFFNLGFYRMRANEPLGKIIASGRLTAGSGEEAQDNMLICSPGDEVDIEYNDEKERYEVYCGGYIGCLPKSLEQYADTNVIMVISDIKTLDSGKDSVVIDVHEVKEQADQKEEKI